MKKRINKLEKVFSPYRDYPEVRVFMKQGDSFIDTDGFTYTEEEVRKAGEKIIEDEKKNPVNPALKDSPRIITIRGVSPDVTIN
jgi:hypothetical protein